MLERSAKFSDYLSLDKSNQDLLSENARLLQEIIGMPRAEAPTLDSSQLQYEVIPATLINNSILSIRNQFTIDKGSLDGIKPAMGVITPDGVVGIIKSVNDHYSIALSLINVDIRVSGSIEGADFFGTISWDGQSFRYLLLKDIPTYADVKIGDQVITNGFSTIFPKGVKIGKVHSFDINKNGAFYDVSVIPEVDFASLRYVYVLKANFAEQMISFTEDE